MDGFELRQILGRDEVSSTALKAALTDYRGPRTKIHQLIRKKVLIPLKKGFYVFGPRFRLGTLNRESIAMQLYGPSAVSLESALSYHGLIPERVHTVTCITPKRDKKFNTQIGTFSYRRLVGSKFGFGLVLIQLDANHSFWIASPTKALCDQVYLERKERLSSRAEVQAYLSEDLRLDLKRLKKLVNKSELRQIAKAYKSANVEALCKYLETK